MDKNNWNLWLDDQFDDPDMPFRHCPPDFMAARSVQESKELIRLHGIPKFIDFDHDLGDGHDAPELIHWMYEIGHLYIYGALFVPEYAVHSANPCGRDSIVSLMETWKKVAAMPSKIKP